MRVKHLISIVLVLTLTAVGSYARPSVPDTLRLLTVGNSFGEDAVEQNLHEIAAADGKVLIIGSLYIGGCSLERHWSNAESDAPAYRYRKIAADGSMTEKNDFRLSEAFADDAWDVVTFQQSSRYCGRVESYEPYMGNFVKYARARTPKGVRLMMHQTWAHAKNATNENFARYNCDQLYMYNSLTEANRAMVKKYKLGIVPSGTAIQNSRGTFTRENVTRDGFHLSLWYGRYIAACTYYEALFGTSVVGNSYIPPHLEQERIVNAQRCAHAANLQPYAVSEIEQETLYYNSNPKAIPPYTLPDPLTMQDGSKVENAEQWYSQRRPKLLGLFETEMFGKDPGRVPVLKNVIESEAEPAFGGKAIRHEVDQIYMDDGRGYRKVLLLVYTPADAKGPVPVFLGVNFKGNTAIADDPGIHEAFNDTYGARQKNKYGIWQPVERGSQASRWPIEEIIDRGYGVATFFTSDVDPDFADGGSNGLTRLIYKKGQRTQEPDQWGNIAAWAWGLSQALDYLETYDRVDASRVAVFGHSRLGKAALWAGAHDERFAMVISNDSGCCGAALSRRRIGETVHAINRAFPHWFCENFKKYNDREDELPFDQHELLACVAPRPVYVASAEQDGWADPVGERLALQEAAKVYRFLGLDEGLLGYHIREGAHGITVEDWRHYLDFADKHLKR